MAFFIAYMEKISFAYAFFRVYFQAYHNWFWYKSIIIRGRKNVPRDKPIILAPNHQNALMDATAFVFTLSGQVVFLARADIFVGKIIPKILNSIRILPIYRMRDGAQSLGKNEIVFNKSVQILENNHLLALFPEAQHWGFRKLRSIKKGIPRIAFIAEERNDFKLGSVVQPVGLYYDEYQSFRKKLLINYGQPIPVAQFRAEYEQNENIGFMALRKAITEGMKAVMMHIETDKYYDDVENLRTIIGFEACIRNGGNPANVGDEFDADRKTVSLLDKLIVTDEPRFLDLKAKADEYLTLLDELSLPKWVIPSGGYRLLSIFGLLMLGIVLFPLFLFGVISHGLVYWGVNKFVKAKVKDPQFVRSFKFALCFFVLPINFAIFLGLIAIFVDMPWYLWISTFIFLPVFGGFAFDYASLVSKCILSIRYRFGLGMDSSKKARAIALHKEIVRNVLG